MTFLTTWTLLTPVHAPSDRRDFVLAYDPIRNVVVFFGGQTNAGTPLGDTWEWDGTDWTEIFPAHSPSARVHAAMAYHWGINAMVLFGGNNTTETWTYDGTDWTQVFPATTPYAGISPIGEAMGSDVANSNVVMFGGLTTLGVVDRTYTYDGTDWTLETPGTSPPAGTQESLAFDAINNVVTMFTATPKTWTWDGSDWTDVSPVTQPAARSSASGGDGLMAWNDLFNNITLFGGYAGAATFQDTWFWDGTAWTEQFPIGALPQARATALARDPGTGSVMFFGGYDNLNPTGLGGTWRLDPVPPDVTTGEATGICGAATLCGTITPNADSGVVYYFEYGPDTSYGYQTKDIPISGFVPVDVCDSSLDSFSPLILVPGVTYHFRISSGSDFGPAFGADATFVEGACPPSLNTEFSL